MSQYLVLEQGFRLSEGAPAATIYSKIISPERMTRDGYTHARLQSLGTQKQVDVRPVITLL
jgi:hypothetical protein